MRNAVSWLVLALGLALGAPSTAAADDWTETERRVLARHGWGTFFAQTGFALAATTGALVMSDVGWSIDHDEAAIGLLMPIFTGAGSALGYAMEDWSSEVGWALAGTWPGAALGVSAILGVALLEGQRDPDDLLGVAAAGFASGAALGAIAWLLETLDHGSPGGLTGCFWAGYFTGLLSGFAAMSTTDDPEARAIPLLSATVGALLGVLVEEIVRSDG